MSAKSAKSLMFLTSALVSAGVVIEPVAANAGGMSQLDTWGHPAGMSHGVSNLSCDGVPPLAGINNIRQINVPRANTNAGAFRPNNIQQPGLNQNVGGNVTGNIGLARPLNVQ